MSKRIALLLLALFIEGAALMSVELMGAKLMASFYGTSLYVWTSVLCITVLGLTFGYFFGGILSEKMPSKNVLFSILAISALLVFLMPTTSNISVLITKDMSLVIGIIVSSLLLLIPPMFCFGLVGPLVVRLITNEIITLGKKAGTVYFVSTFAGIIATFVFGFYLIPEKGLRYCSKITALALASLPVIYLIMFFFRKILFTKKSNTQNNILSTENAPVEKVEKSIQLPPINKGLILFVIIEGAAVMATELLVARMLAPYFGSSLYIWGTVIGITLISLAIGYLLGGFLADKFKEYNLLMWCVLISSIFLLLLHFSSQKLIALFSGMESTSSVIWISFFLLFPPLALLGMVPTMLIRYLSKNVSNSGRMTGLVYTLSSASGIATLLILGFLIIPKYGITVPSILIGFFVGIFPFIKLIKQKKYLSLLFIPILLLSTSIKKVTESNSNIEIQYFSEGLLGQVLVSDVHTPISENQPVAINERILFVNRMGQTFVDLKSGNSKWNYIHFATSVTSKLPEQSNVLLLGLGGGSLADVFYRNLKFSVDAIELDERIATVATDFFGLNPNVNVIIDDARHYLESTTKQYDLIFFDVFKGDIPPAHVLTLETFLKAKSLLRKNGFIIVNFNGFINGDIGLPGRSLFKTLQAAGLYTKLLPTPGNESDRNNLFIACQQPTSFNDIRSPLLHAGIPVSIDSLLLDSKSIDFKNSFIFSDDKPNLEMLNMKAGNIWRKGYTDTYTKMFSENGIPLFQ